MSADFYDTRIIEGISTSIVTDNKILEEARTGFSQGVIARALVGGSWGFSTTSDPSKIDECLTSATRLAEKAQQKNKREKLQLPDMKIKGGRFDSDVHKNPADTSIEEKAELVREIENNAIIDEVASTSATYMESHVNMKYSNSHGEESEYELWRVGFMVHAVAHRNGTYQMGGEHRFGPMGMELFDIFDPMPLARKAAQTAVELLDAKPAPGGRFPVVLDQELAGVFIHEAMGHAAEADIILEGGSILEGKLGEQIASPNITVFDDPNLLEYGYMPFDDEGIPAKRRTLIEDGVLVSYLHSRETAARLGGDPGNARAQGCSNPIVRMSNTYVKNGDTPFEDMLGEIKDGVYLIGSRGGQVNTAEGYFLFNAERGHLIENGELKTALRDVSLSGNTLQILKNVELVGDDLILHSGHCGKGGQTVPVTDGSPHLMISEATVGGVA